MELKINITKIINQPSEILKKNLTTSHYFGDPVLITVITTKFLMAHNTLRARQRVDERGRGMLQGK